MLTDDARTDIRKRYDFFFEAAKRVRDLGEVAAGAKVLRNEVEADYGDAGLACLLNYIAENESARTCAADDGGLSAGAKADIASRFHAVLARAEERPDDNVALDADVDVLMVAVAQEYGQVGVGFLERVALAHGQDGLEFLRSVARQHYTSIVELSRLGG